MRPSSPLYCTACGAANQTQATLCWACGQLFPASTGDTVLAPPLSAQQPAPPALLARRYRIIGMVGKGGFGAVYKAEDMQRNDAFVAIKEINLSGLSPQEMIEATDTFNREVRLLSGLEHPNLPRIFDHFTDAEHWYLAMDFIEGETLEEYLGSTKGKHLPVAEVLDIGMQLCTVLHYLHTRQPPIIFRDVKPANVMRTATGHLYLIDFGIARHFTPGQARDTSALGSPGYAAPEQYGRAQTTVQSDIYSLGVTLQTLLTGKDPLEPPSGSASLYAEDVSAELELLLVQMLDLDADQRPASMDAVKRTLQSIKEGPSPKVLPADQLPHSSGYAVSTMQQTPTPVRTVKRALQLPATSPAQRVTVVIGGILLLLGGLSAAYYSITWNSEGDTEGLTAAGHGLLVFLLFAIGGVMFLAGLIGLAKRMPKRSSIITSLVGVGLIVGLPTIGGGIAQLPLFVGPYPLSTYTYDSGQVDQQVDAVAWSPDGKHIASGYADGTVQVWDATDGGHVYTYRGHSDPVNTVAWSPDGKRIASGSGGDFHNQQNDHTVQVWDAANGGHVVTYRGHSSAVLSVAWSPDGKRIASASQDGTVQVWDAADGRHIHTYGRDFDTPAAHQVTALAWLPDGKRIASSYTSIASSYTYSVVVWDTISGSGTTLFTYPSATTELAWSPNGKRIAMGDFEHTVQVWDAATGAVLLTYRRNIGLANVVAWSPDGKRIASGSWGGTVQVWDAS